MYQEYLLTTCVENKLNNRLQKNNEMIPTYIIVLKVYLITSKRKGTYGP